MYKQVCNWQCYITATISIANTLFPPAFDSCCAIIMGVGSCIVQKAAFPEARLPAPVSTCCAIIMGMGSCIVQKAALPEARLPAPVSTWMSLTSLPLVHGSCCAIIMGVGPCIVQDNITALTNVMSPLPLQKMNLVTLSFSIYSILKGFNPYPF